MFNPILFYEAGKQRIFPINTIIGGVASTISTKSLLATKLGISESNILTFKVVGTDVQAYIINNYIIPTSAFVNNTEIKSFIDLDGKVTQVNQQGFRNTGLLEINLPNASFTEDSAIGYNTALTVINLPNLTVYGNQLLRQNTGTKQIYLPKLESIRTITTNTSSDFANLSSLELLDAKKLKVYGRPSTGYGATESGFNLLKSGCVININVALKTANAGAVAEAFRWAKTVRSAIVNFYNDDGTFNSTL